MGYVKTNVTSECLKYIYVYISRNVQYMAQCVERCPLDLKVPSSIPHHGDNLTALKHVQTRIVRFKRMMF